MLLTALVFVLSLPGAAPVSAASPDRGRHEFRLIGWSSACSVAFEHYRYPALGQGLQEDPSEGRVGTVTLAPRARRPLASWLIEETDRLVWDHGASEEAAARLRQRGYGEAGFVEELLESPAGDPRIHAVLRSSVGFELAGSRWPADGRLTRVYYSSSAPCALLLFKRHGALDFHLARAAAGTRARHAAAHLKNQLHLYRDRDDLDGALLEAAAAARMLPESPEARFVHAAMLSAHGRFDESLAELAEAVKLDRGYAAKARSAPEFEELRTNQRFKELTGEDEAPELWP